MIFCSKTLREIFSLPHLGKKTVIKTPKKKTKNGEVLPASQTKVSGADKVAKAKTTLAIMVIISLMALRVKIQVVLFLMTLAKSFR